ncbi:MAG: class I SAM-dependent methyltransferase [Myxococcales bacterium]|nr:class I SAM-dependent methyltransferase [Myxococcales bacterium]MCB9526734.1 class I SAM-dependent methyltransferase [Myxococcales bacterium]
MTADPRFWDRIAERYAAKPVDDPAAFERKIAITLDRLPPGGQVLDVGCGTGSLCLRLAPHGGQVQGLDLSPEMIRIARGKAAAAQAANVAFQVGPFDDTFTAVADGSLDVVCAYSLLHLVRDRPAALRHLFRLLKPGGSFIASTACLGGGWVPFGLILGAMRRLGKAPWVGVVSRAQLAAEIQAAGFVDLQAPDVGAKSKTVYFTVARRP